MATKSSLKACLGNASVSSNKLPQAIHEAAKKGDGAAMLAALEEHEKQLYSLRDSVRAQHRKNIRGFMRQGAEQSYASSFVKHPEDPSNELNKFQPITNLKKHLQNWIQRTGSAVLAVAHLKKNRTNAKNEENELEILSDYADNFEPSISAVIEQLMKHKGVVDPADQAKYDAAVKKMKQLRGTRNELKRDGKPIPDSLNKAIAKQQEVINDATPKDSFPFRYEDMMQYFVRRGENNVPEPIVYEKPDGTQVSSLLDPVLKASIAATAYEWIGTDSHLALGQTEVSKKMWLGLEKDQRLPYGHKHLNEIGVRVETLAAQLGAKILKRSGIEPSADARADAKGRMEMSLGFMAIAAMERAKILELQEVYTGLLSDEEIEKRKNPKYKGNGLEEGTFGIEGLKSGTLTNPEDRSSVVYDPSTGVKEGAPTIKYVAFKDIKTFEDTNGIKRREPSHKRIVEIQKLMGKAPNVFNKLFANDPEAKGWSWNKPTLPAVLRIGDSIKHKAHPTQAQNIKTYSHTPYVHNRDMSQVFMGLDSEFRNAILGMVTEDDGANILDVKLDSALGVNIGIERDIQLYQDWLEKALEREAKGESIEFYIPSDFYNNTRMGQKGGINPQGSKVMRNLFSPKGWRVSFIPKEGHPVDSAFREAIAQAFGIESGKVGGVENQLAELADLLRTDRAALEQKEDGSNDDRIKFNRGLTAMKTYLSSGEFDSADQQQKIVDAVDMLGEKMHSLKGLVELARYQLHMENNPGTSFETDIYKEIDGVSNGPVIGVAQLITDDADKRAVLASLAMGGISVDLVEQNLDELIGNRYLNDAYQRMGQIWAKNVLTMRQQFAAEDIVERMDAISFFIGEFQGTDPKKDDFGIVNKTIRNLSKPRTMQTTYNAGTFRQQQIFTESDVLYDGIYAHLEDILKDLNHFLDTNEGDYDAIEKRMTIFLFRVGQLTFEPNKNGKAKDGLKHESIDDYKTKGQLDPAKIRAYKFERDNTRRLMTLVQETYGKAMADAITEIYGENIAARSPFLDSVNVLANMYNLILTKKLEIWKKNHPDQKLSVGDLNEILESIQDVLPKIRTPYSDDIGESFLPLVSAARGREKKTLAQTPVVQSYAGNQVQTHKGNATYIPLLGQPGAAPMVRGIQMIDAAIANALMGAGIDFLNNHDGFSHSIKDSDIVRQVANRRFYEILDNYSLGAEFARMHNSTMPAAQKLIKELQITNQELFDELVDNDVIGYPMVAKYILGKDGHSFVKTDVDSMVERLDEEFNLHMKKLYEDGGSPDRKAERRKFIRKQLGTPNKEMIQSIFTQLDKDVRETAKQTTKNLKHLMKYVTNVAQYPDKGKGYPVVRKTDNKTIWGMPVQDVLRIDENNTRKDVKTVQELVRLDQARRDAIAEREHVRMGLGSGIGASTDENDYRPDSSKIVDRQNLQEVFESFLDLDRQAGVASVPVSKQHQEHLSGILKNIVSKVMTPVELFHNDHMTDDRQTVGVWVPGKNGEHNRVFIQTQRKTTTPPSGILGQSIRMSAAETYAHEMVHNVTAYGINGKSVHHVHIAKQIYALYKKVQESSDWTMFLDDPMNFTKWEKEAAEARWEYLFNPDVTKDKDTGAYGYLHEFVAYGLTNEKFKQHLSNIKLDDKTVKMRTLFSGLKGSNLQETLMNVFNRILDLIHQTLFKQEHSTRMDQELENLVRSMTEIDNRAKTSILKSIYNKEAVATALSVATDERVKAVANKAWSATKVGKFMDAMKKIPDANNLIAHHIRVALLWYNDQEAGLIPSIVTEMQQNTARLRPFHDLIQRRNRTIDAAKQSAAEKVQSAIATWFKDAPLTSHQKVSVTKALMKTDAAALLDKFTWHGFKQIVSDRKVREDRINKIMREFRADKELKLYADFFENASDDLAFYMITSKALDIDVPLMNADNIVDMMGTKHAEAITGDKRTETREKIDELVSLMAFRYVREDYINEVAQLLESNEKAMESVMRIHESLKRDAAAQLFAGQEALMQKGYTKSIVNSRIQYKMGTIDERQKYEDMGYIMQAEPLPRDPNDLVAEDIYMFKSMLGTVNDLQSGILSYTRNSARGKSMFDIQLQTGNFRTPGPAANRVEAHMSVVMARKLDNMFKPRKIPRHIRMDRDDSNYMVPKMGPKGEIHSVRYVMTEMTKDHVLQQHSEFDAIMGAMAAQIIDKQHTPEINKDTIYALKDLYDTEYHKYPEAYVEVSPFSKNPQYREFYALLPEGTKQVIKSVWGSQRMMVSRDIVDLTFGQRKQSIVDLFAKSNRELKAFERIVKEVIIFALGFYNPIRARNQQGSNALGRAINRAKKIEDTMTQLTKLGKSNIIVRNFSVTRGNYMSNMAYLKSKGVPMESIINLSREAMNSAIRYQRDKSALDTLRLERDIMERKASLNYNDRVANMTKMDRQIAQLEHQIAINPSTPLIEAGLMPQIIDDVDTVNLQTPYKFGIDKAIDTGLSKLPGKRLERVSRALFMTEDTEGYRILNNAVRMTDYVGRYVLYHHYRNPPHLKHQVKGMKVRKVGDKPLAMSHADAISAVTEEFINFDLPTHRNLEYLNQVGVLWFSKYQLRVLKHIKNLIKDKPFTTLATYILGMGLAGGNNILNSVPGMTKDLFQAWGDPATAFIDSTPQIFNVDVTTDVADLAGDMF